MPPFKPKAEKEEINYSSQNSLMLLSKLVLGTIVVASLIVGVFGLAGEFLLVHLGSSVERFAFRFDAVDVFKGDNYPEGKKVLTKLIGNEAEQFKIIEIKEDAPNAIAIPGHIIAVTSGAIKSIHTEQGLAFLIGHEYGHFLHHDHIRGLGFGIGVAFSLNLIGLDEFGNWISNLSGTIISRRYSQAQEAAADDVAIALLQEKYGSLNGATEFFDSVIAESPDGTFDSIFSTHPLTQDRIKRIKDLAAQDK